MNFLACIFRIPLVSSLRIKHDKLNLLDDPHECGTIQLLQIVVVLHHVQPCVYGLLVLPAVLHPHYLAADVRQYDLCQYLLIDIVGRTGIFTARSVPVADIRL